MVWAIESVCYADSKRDFIEEAYRVLRKGGRLIVADLFTTKATLSPDEERLLYARAMNRFAVNALETSANFERYKESVQIWLLLC